MSYYTPFDDFLFFKPHASTFHSAAFFTTEINYPAPLACFLEFWYLLPWPLPLYLCSILVPFIFSGIIFAKKLTALDVPKQGLFVLLSVLAVSYPLWFEFERGNTEAAVWLVMAFGIWAFMRERPYIAAACFGVAGSMKLFPFVFLGLLLARRQYRQVVFAGIVAASLLIASLWLESGSVMRSWHASASAAEPFRVNYLLKVDSSGFDHSLFALLKQSVAGHDRSSRFTIEFASMLHWYMIIAALTGVALFFWRIQKLPVVNQILTLTVASILLPPVSYDYTLIHLYVPCALLVFVAVKSHKSAWAPAGVGPALLVMAVLMAPETEIIAKRVSLGGDIKCLALIALFVIALRYPFDLEPSQVVSPA